MIQAQAPGIANEKACSRHAGDVISHLRMAALGFVSQADRHIAEGYIFQRHFCQAVEECSGNLDGHRRHMADVDASESRRALIHRAVILIGLSGRRVRLFVVVQVHGEGQSTLSITRLLMRTSSTTPPRPRRDFKRTPRSVPRKMQLLTVTFRTSPLISLPITKPP